MKRVKLSMMSTIYSPKVLGLIKRSLVLVLLFFAALPLEAQFRESYFERGYKEVRRRNYPKAVEYLNYSISERDYFQAYFFRGFAKFQMNDLWGSEADFTKCIEQVPTHNDALHYRAIVRSQLLNYEAAFKDFEMAIRYDSTNEEIYLNRAISYLSIENYEEAIADCNRSQRLNPKDLKSLVIRAIAETELENFELAMLDFNKVIRKEPLNALALTHRASCLRQLGRFEEAESDIRFILLKDSMNVDALLQLAFLENERENSSAALDVFNQVLSISPYNTIALFNRGVLRTSSENYQGALADYNEVLKTNRNNVSVYFNRALLKQKMNKPREALLDLDKVVELLPNFSNAYLARAQIKRSLNDVDGAEKDVALAGHIEVQNAAMAEKGISDKQLASIMKTLKLANSSTKNTKEPESSETKYVAVELRPFFHLIPAHFVNRLNDYYLKDDELPTTELMGLITSNSEISLEKVQSNLDSLKNLEDSEELDYNGYLKRGILYTQNESYNLAFQDFDAVIRLKPENMLAYFGRANTRLKLKELMEEFDEPQQFIQEGEVIEVKDSTYEESHSYAMIIQDYQKSIRLDNSFSYAYYNLAYAQNKNNQIQESLESLNKAIQVREDFSEAYFNRGLTHLFLKENTKACADLSKAGELGIKEAYVIISRYCSK